MLQNKNFHQYISEKQKSQWVLQRYFFCQPYPLSCVLMIRTLEIYIDKGDSK